MKLFPMTPFWSIKNVAGKRTTRELSSFLALKLTPNSRNMGRIASGEQDVQFPCELVAHVEENLKLQLVLLGHGQRLIR